MRLAHSLLRIAIYGLPAVLSLLQAASGPAILTDDAYDLPPGEWRWVRFEIRHRPATVECSFGSAAGEVHAELVNRPDLELFREHRRHDTLAYTDNLRAGGFHHYIEEPGQYAVVIENPGKEQVRVHLKVALSFGPPRPVSRYLSPTRRFTVILVSFVAFFAIVTFSTRALLRSMKRP